MHNKMNISRLLLIMAAVFGVWMVYMVNLLLRLEPGWNIMVGIGGLLSFYLASGCLLKLLQKAIKAFDRLLDNTSLEILIGGTTGLLLGLLTGILCTYPLSMLEGAGTYLTIIIFVLSAFMGLKIGTRKAIDVFHILPGGVVENEDNKFSNTSTSKVLDTSAIIDGRIYDVCLSSFLEGALIVPTFVIEELQHIADSSDNIRRNKGRRGLELLSKMQKNPRIKIDIIDVDIMEEKEVDAKLIRLCKKINAGIITNDYNLNKVAELQGITVLNINELTNAVKIMVYPGENMHTCIVREGKEAGQGVGYLEDGTMVVVEDASNEIGKDIDVVVTSVFQTAAGRMIFTRKVKEEKENNNTHSIKDVQEVNVYG